jgi:hypothetical protein
MDKRLYFELMAELSHKDTWVHYYFVYYETFIILNQLRCFASLLNYDLFQVNIVSDPSCHCGANREDSHHFFFDCSHYSNIRHNEERNERDG